MMTGKRRSGRLPSVSLFAAAALLTACAPSGLNEACSIVDGFSRRIIAAETYADLSDLASWLASDLEYVADISQSTGLRSDLQWAAGAARDVVTVIRRGSSRDTIDFEIDGLIFALDNIRSRC